MDEKQLKEKLRTGSVGGCYFFVGEEEYLKRYYLGELKRAVIHDESLSTFNHIIFDGQDISLADIADAIKAPPMFEDFKLIEWRYPSILKLRESELNTLEELIISLKEYDYTVLAITVADGEVELGTAKRQSKFEKRFSEIANILAFGKQSDAALISWLKRHFDKEEIATSPESLSALLFRTGHNMDNLASEVKKLSAYLHARGVGELTVADVNEVATSTPECDTFALSNAILERNKRAAFVALDEMKRERQEPTVITGMMAKTYSELLSVTLMLEAGMGKDAIASALGMHPYRLGAYIKATRLFKPGAPRAILDELTRVDVGAKYGGVSGYTAVEMFVSKCL